MYPGILRPERGQNQGLTSDRVHRVERAREESRHIHQGNSLGRPEVGQGFRRTGCCPRVIPARTPVDELEADHIPSIAGEVQIRQSSNGADKWCCRSDELVRGIPWEIKIVVETLMEELLDKTRTILKRCCKSRITI